MKTLTVNKGERFGRLVVIKEVEPRQYKKGKVRRFKNMIDRVQKIREKVVEMVNSINPFIPDEDGKNSDYEAGKLDAATQILQIIDSLEEPVSEELEEAAKHNTFKYVFDKNVKETLISELKYIGDNSFKDGVKWQKAKDESTTEDLGEYINELSKQFPEVSFAKLSRIAVRVAKWQREQDKETIEFAEDHAMLAGMEKMKEQMMAKAVDGDITFDYYGDGDKTYGCIAHNSFCLEDFGLKDRDKVKVIVIKED